VCIGGDDGLTALGLLAVLAGRKWGTIGAHHTARDRNRALRKRLWPAAVPSGEALSVGLRISF
jgi:hypothetical protein